MHPWASSAVAPAAHIPCLKIKTWGTRIRGEESFILVRMRLSILSIAFAFLAHNALAQTLTAAEAIHKIQQRYASPAEPNTVDTIKAGDPSTPVKGIATTFLDTMDVLREADKRGLNLIITHEPTFYNHPDDTSFLKNNPVYREKLAFIEQHHMVVFRLHDEIHAVAPDHIEIGLLKALGWQAYVKPENPFLFTIPPTTLGALADQLAKKFNVKTMRVVGDPKLSITHVAIEPGAGSLRDHLQALERDDVDVLIAGEASEWESVEYVRDASAQGRPKGLIILGHQVSEEPGMEQCAQDLKAVFPGLKVEHIVAGSPLWNPEYPPVAK
jgi:putative NIF3 family GTP cyclohydrolase 1 type 2